MALTEEQKTKAKIWRDANKEKRAEYQREYAKRNRHKLRQYSKDFYERNPDKPYHKYDSSQRDKSRISHHKYKFGVTAEMFNEMYEAQAGQCCLCKVHFDSSSKSTKPHLDHDHMTNKVRGLLCHRCNVGLGQFKDNIDTLKAAVQYLDQYA